ncbi:MAG: hypothetical protein ACRDZ2_09705, partial [Ilumatobacteraceae bacterium]
MTSRRRPRWGGAVVALTGVVIVAACGGSPRELAPLGPQPASTVAVDLPSADVDPFGSGSAGGAIGADTLATTDPITPTTAGAATSTENRPADDSF